MKKRFDLLSLILCGVVCALVAFAVVMAILVYFFGGLQGLRYAQKFAQVERIIEEQYIGESDPKSVSDAALAAMIESLDDRWSYYMTAEEYDSYKQYVRNAYTGIGVTIQQDEETGGLLVVSVTEGGPADEAGIVAGDLLLGIDGESILGWTNAQVREVIQSRYGQDMQMLVRRSDGTEETLVVTCAEVKVDPVRYELLDGDIGYIQISNFEEDSAQGAITAIEDLVGQGAEKLIFDVRNNPGGRVSQLTKLLDYLLPEGDIFISVSEDGKETVTRSDSDCVEMPMAVLVNAGSYSAAEFFAAALWEYDWADVVGEATTGKGRSQITIELSDGSAVHLSTKKYLTPDRVDLSEVGGLEPSLSIEQGEDSDTQLKAAIDLLSEKAA